MKRVTFLVEEELFKKAKIKTIQTNQNMTEYLTLLIVNDLGDTKTKKEQTR